MLSPDTTLRPTKLGRLGRSFALGVIAWVAPTGLAQMVNVAEQAGLLGLAPPEAESPPPNGLDPFTIGGAAAAADLNGDGWTDLILARMPGKLHVFINQGDGTFVDEAATRGLGDMEDINGIAVGDLSNSGYQDIFLAPRAGERFFLFVNDGTGNFIEQAVDRGADMAVAGEPHKSQSVSLVDYDRDGFLDIHVTEWASMPGAPGAQYAVLLRTRGREAPGPFQNATAGTGLVQPHFGTSNWGFVSGWADFDQDGLVDVTIVCDFGTSQFWWNNGDGTFTESRDATGAAQESNGMGIAIADYDRDGWLDYYVTSIELNPEDGLISDGRLYRYVGDRQFEDTAAEQGVVHSEWGWGAAFFDANNDGLSDLIATNGYGLNPSSGPVTEDEPGEVVIDDAAADRTKLFINLGNRFDEQGIDWGVVDQDMGRGIVVLDFDNDGDEDLMIGQSYADWVLYRNDSSAADASWLRLQFRGTVSNRDGFGTLVRVTTGDVTQTLLYHPTNSMVGQREPFLHFGLGDAVQADRVEINWPSGVQQILTNVSVRQILSVVEPMEAVFTAPTFQATPSNTTATNGERVAFSVAATGEPFPAISWFKDGELIPGATTMELEFERIHPTDEGVYQVVATNSEGTVTSPGFSLRVVAPTGPRSTARWWNEALLEAIRADFPDPPVHARNLFHLSATLWDVYWAFEPAKQDEVSAVYHRPSVSSSLLQPAVKQSARAEAMSHAAHRLLSQRFALSPGSARSLAGFDWLMDHLGYAIGDPSPAAQLGRDVADQVLAATINDGANEANNYADATGYAAVNEPLIPAITGTTMMDPDRWQPLSLAFSITQNGLAQPTGPQTFIGGNAALAEPFALLRPGPRQIRNDPGAPPLLVGAGRDEVVAAAVELIEFSSFLDPDDGVEIDISPGVSMNNPLGSNQGTGHAVNPATGEPYAPNVVKQADFGRLVAEYWADGPASETPPGHWNVIFNTISDAIPTPLRWAGQGTVLDRLAWDVRGYMALNGAVYDAAVAAWTVKRRYDSARPISVIRHLAGLGQSTDPGLPRYHEDGLPLIPDLIELTTAETLASGGRHSSLESRRDETDGLVDQIVIKSWRGAPSNPTERAGGVDWILAERWMPYQLPTFVSPGFPGYVSGHSTFSRAAAEVLTLITGDAYFPGGIWSRRFPQGTSLKFEYGPTVDVDLQWGTYYDAADQAGISRIYGGIHPIYDDLPGRILGSRVGLEAWLKAQRLRFAEDVAPGLVNVSARGVSGAGEEVLITGFVVASGDTTEVLVRAVGPTLTDFGLDAAVVAPDPSLEVYQAGETSPLLSNDDWNASPRSDEVLSRSGNVGAFALPEGSADAAELVATTGGAYTLVVPSGAPEGRRVELVEAYGERLTNVSVRGFVDAGDEVMIAGFVVSGPESVPLLIRGVGPTLADFGVQGVLADPVIRINRLGAVTELVATNDDWGDDAKASLAQTAADVVGAFALPSGSADAVLFVQLEPGSYTVTLSGKSASSGVGLIEVYLLR